MGSRTGYRLSRVRTKRTGPLLARTELGHRTASTSRPAAALITVSVVQDGAAGPRTLDRYDTGVSCAGRKRAHNGTGLATLDRGNRAGYRVPIVICACRKEDTPERPIAARHDVGPAKLGHLELKIYKSDRLYFAPNLQLDLAPVDDVGVGDVGSQIACGDAAVGMATRWQEGWHLQGAGNITAEGEGTRGPVDLSGRSRRGHTQPERPEQCQGQ